MATAGRQVSRSPGNRRVRRAQVPTRPAPVMRRSAPVGTGSMGARGVLQLQQLVGNRAVTEMIQRSAPTEQAGQAVDAEMDDGCACGGGCSKCSTAVSRSAATEAGAGTGTTAPAEGDVAEGGMSAHLVDSDPAPGQMTKDAFLSELQGAVTATASGILAPTGWTAENCPDLARWFAYYQDKDAGHVERAIHKYAPGTANAESARDYIPAIARRVQRAVLRWTITGEVTGVPEEAEATPGAPAVPSAEEIASSMNSEGSEEDGAGPPLQRAARDGATALDAAPAGLSNLGQGERLDGSVASRFGSALGSDFSHVRVHKGAQAATAASALGARAFTYGHHIGFDSGEYQPGTPVGDAILAHELAHIDQQRNATATLGTAPRPNAPVAPATAARDNNGSIPAGPTGNGKALEHDADRAATGAIARLWTAASDVADGVLQAPERLRSARPRLQRCEGCGSGCGTSQAPPLSSSPATSTGTDFHGGVGRPTGSQISAIETALNPTSSGPGGAVLTWDGLADPAKRQQLKTELLTALQNHLNAVNPDMQAKQTAKAAGNVLSTTEQEGAGRAAKRYVDNMFGDLASSAVLTSSQEAARAAFRFQGGSGPGANLLDASDPSVRPLTPALRDDLVDWITDTDPDARQAQRNHGFNRLRDPTNPADPERVFYEARRAEFIGTGTNQADLDRYNQFGFSYSQQNPTRVLSQTAIPAGGALSNTPVNPGEPSPAERRERWATWETLVHEYIHTLEHPSFTAASRGNRILLEGFCELFTKAVLAGGSGGVSTAKADGDTTLRHDVEGGDIPGFTPSFVPDYDPGSYTDYLTGAEAIVSEVGMQAARAAFFLGHVEAIGLKPDGTMIDPTAPDADQFLAPERVRIPASVTTVRRVAQMTGVGESEIVAANSGLAVGGTLPASAHTTGLTIPNTSYHRTVGARSATQHEVETKAKIAEQHGIAEADIVRANPALASREPSEGEWVLIPNH